jgi:hypothetical protein
MNDCLTHISILYALEMRIRICMMWPSVNENVEKKHFTSKAQVLQVNMLCDPSKKKNQKKKKRKEKRMTVANAL